MLGLEHGAYVEGKFIPDTFVTNFVFDMLREAGVLIGVRGGTVTCSASNLNVHYHG